MAICFRSCSFAAERLISGLILAIYAVSVNCQLRSAPKRLRPIFNPVRLCAITNTKQTWHFCFAGGAAMGKRLAKRTGGEVEFAHTSAHLLHFVCGAFRLWRISHPPKRGILRQKKKKRQSDLKPFA
jgi:hypothetical protein